MKEPAVSLFQTDYYAWVQDQIDTLRRGEFEHLDLANLIDEVESLGRSQSDQLESRMEQLLLHLLKWEYQPDRRGASWTATIREQRRRIAKLLKRMPSLRPKLDEFLADNYDDAREMAAAETGLDPRTFPPTCPYEMAHILDLDWLPAS